MPPTTTVWTTVAGAVVPSWPPLPPTGITDVDAMALLAKLTATTARLASTAPSRLRLLMVLIEWFSLPGFPGRGLGRPPGPLRSLPCDAMARAPRSGSGALPSFAFRFPSFRRAGEQCLAGEGLAELGPGGGRSRGHGRSGAGRHWRNPRSAAVPARPSGVPAALREHRIGRNDRSAGTETKSRYLIPRDVNAPAP